MALKDALLPEFDHEMAVTRTLLERVPGGRGGWKPHAKSMSLGDLAMHLANLPEWMRITLDQDEFDLNPPGGAKFDPRRFESAPQVLAEFDRNVSNARELLTRTTDGQYMQPWSLKDGGVVRLTLPRAAVVRSFVLSHTIHHRAQLGVYLRLLDVPVPRVYGPTADEI